MLGKQKLKTILNCVGALSLIMLVNSAMASPGDIEFSGAPASAVPGEEFDVILAVDVGALRYQSSTLVLQFSSELLELKSIATETSPVLTSTRPGFPTPPTSGLDGTGLFAIRGAETSFSLSGIVQLHRLTFAVLANAATDTTAEIGLVALDSRNSIFGRTNANSPGEEIALSTSNTQSVIIEDEVSTDCFTLTVSGGIRNTATDCTASGGVGGYTRNKVVSISASQLTGKDFVTWTGDTSTIADVNSESTTITMDANKSVMATYINATNCTLTVSGGSTSIPAEGGTTNDFIVDITGSGCEWSATVDHSAAILSGDADSFNVSMPTNLGTTEQFITIVVTPAGNDDGAVTRVITQAAPVPCTLTVSGGSTSVPPSGGTTSAFIVDMSTAECSWSAQLNLGIGTISPTGGSDNDNFMVTIPENVGSDTIIHEVTVTPEGNANGVWILEIAQPPYGRELLERTIQYGDCWQRSGLVQVPGATRLRLVLDSLNIEPCCDVLTVFGDETEEYRGEAGGPFRTAFVTGNTIELVMTSNSYLGGQFTVAAVEYEGVATGSASLSGELFEGAEDGDCPGTFFLGSTYSANPEDGTFSGAYVGKESGEISFYVISLDAPVTWNISTFSGCEFMSVEPSSGISSPGEPSRVVVTYDANTTGEARYCAFSIDSGEGDQQDAFLDQGALELIQTIAQRLILYLGELDTDGDNQLSPEEADIAPNDFDRLDRNSDGLLASWELEKVAYPGMSCSGEVGASPSGLKSDLVLLFLTIGGLILSGKSIGGRRTT